MKNMKLCWIQFYVLFSDAFDLQYGVCVLRMKEGLDVSNPPQSHGESIIKEQFKVFKWSIHSSLSHIDIDNCSCYS